MSARRTLLAFWAKRWGIIALIKASILIVVGNGWIVAKLTFQLHDFLVFHLDQIDKHLILLQLILLLHNTSIELAGAVLNCWELLLLELDNLCRVALIHFDLCLTQGLILCEVFLVLALQESNLLGQLLNCRSRLSLDISGNFLIFCLTCPFQSFDLVLQLLVLICQLSDLLAFVLACV